MIFIQIKFNQGDKKLKKTVYIKKINKKWPTQMWESAAKTENLYSVQSQCMWYLSSGGYILS